MYAGVGGKISLLHIGSLRPRDCVSDFATYRFSFVSCCTRAVGVPPVRAVARPSSTTIAASYVPDGLTPQQYEKIKKDQAEAAAKKKKYFKEKKFEVRALQEDCRMLHRALCVPSVTDCMTIPTSVHHHLLR